MGGGGGGHRGEGLGKEREESTVVSLAEAATSITVLLRQAYFCRGKRHVCCDNHVFVATKNLS